MQQDGGIHQQEYEIGKPQYKVKQVAKTKTTGTIIMFKPDGTIFKEGTNFDFNKIVNHLRNQAYLVKGLKIHVVDARNIDPKNLKNILEDNYWLLDSG